MRYIWNLLFLLMSSVAQAAPSPAPPMDFSGDQYIDGRGCVFSRADNGWDLRTDRDGKPVCGFPSSLSARRTDPDAETVLAPLHQPEPPDPAQLLREQLAAELRQGEFVADTRQAEERREPEIPDTGNDLIAEARGILQLRAAIDAKLAGDRNASDLCARLGYVPDPVPQLIPGGDLMAGLCPGQRPASPEARISPGKRLDNVAKPVTPVSPAASRVSAVREARPSIRQEVKRKLRRDAASPMPKPAAKGETTASQQAPLPELIPASARYVQIGEFSDDDSSEQTIRRLSALGYPVARGYRQGAERKSGVILAGPFNDRRSLVAALNMLRSKGYKAIAR